jgi:hypothetical protein
VLDEVTLSTLLDTIILNSVKIDAVMLDAILLDKVIPNRICQLCNAEKINVFENVRKNFLKETVSPD